MHPSSSTTTGSETAEAPPAPGLAAGADAPDAPSRGAAGAAGSTGAAGTVDDGGWVTARPPRLLEVLLRIVRFPLLVAEHRDLITTSCRRDLEVRFKGTILGWFWPLVQPLFLFAVYYFIFTQLLSIKFGELPPEQKSAMGVFMFTGVIVWTAFAESVNRGTNVIVDNGNLIKKLAFPSELLPLNVTLVGLVTFLFALLVYVTFTLATPVWRPPGIEILWVPVLLLLQALFTYGLLLFLSTIQVFLRDTLQLVGILVTVWMFLTPLFWAPELIPGIERYMPMITANPMYHLVQAWRGVLMGDLIHPGDPTIRYVTTDAIAGSAGVFALWAAGAYVVGYAFFVVSQRRFADEV